MDINKMHGEKASWELHKNVMCCFGHILEAAPHKIAAVQAKDKVTFFYGPLHIDVPVLANQQDLIYISSVQTLCNITNDMDM